MLVRIINILSIKPILSTYLIINPVILWGVYGFITTDRILFRIMYTSILTVSSYSAYIFYNKLQDIIDCKMIKV